jgi:hypothetical protein
MMRKPTLWFGDFLSQRPMENMFLKVVEHCEPEGAAELLWDFWVIEQSHRFDNGPGD